MLIEAGVEVSDDVSPTATVLSPRAAASNFSRQRDIWTGRRRCSVYRLQYDPAGEAAAIPDAGSSIRLWPEKGFDGYGIFREADEDRKWLRACRDC